MKTFGQVITEARKKAGLTQKEVAERLRREDGRKVLPPYLNDLEHDRRYPPENSVIDQLAKILGVSADVLYFHANRLSDDLNRAADGADVQAAFRAFRKALGARQNRHQVRKDQVVSLRIRRLHRTDRVCTRTQPRYLSYLAG